MCFTTTPAARVKIAKTDIVCWKILWSDYTNLYKYVLANPIVYKKNEQMPRVLIRKNKDTIQEGYHSFRSMAHLKQKRRDYGERLLVEAINVKCIIPKGTRYYQNQTEYVSETIMLIE